jgi:hypothetical protein
LGAGGSGMRIGAGTVRGSMVALPATMRAPTKSSKLSRMISGQASAAVYSCSSSRRMRLERLSAEPCTARTWWMVIEPAGPVSMRAEAKSTAQASGSIAPQK